jgi:hypothetical protein
MAIVRSTGRLLVVAALLAAPLTCGAQEPVVAEQRRDAGLERREALPPPAPPGEEPPLLTINGALRGGAQWLVDPPRARDNVFGFGAFDAVVVARPTHEVTVLVDVEATAGPGSDVALHSLSRVNAESERLEGRDTRVFLREAWIRLQALDGAVRFNIGKLDVTHYFDRNFFAEDETRQFLNASLIGNPMLDPPANGPGASIRISKGDWRYAFGVQALDDFSGDHSGVPYIIGELGRRNIFALRGHYRWWARVGSVTERRQDVTWGAGVSIDQLVADSTGGFVRAGLSRRDGERLTSRAFSAGVQHTPSWLGRDKDLAGVGYGFQRQPDGREHVVEAYYNVSLADCCTIIANIEWIQARPSATTSRRDRDSIVPGLRAVILF